MNHLRHAHTEHTHTGHVQPSALDVEQPRPVVCSTALCAYYCDLLPACRPSCFARIRSDSKAPVLQGRLSMAEPDTGMGCVNMCWYVVHFHS